MWRSAGLSDLVDFCAHYVRAGVGSGHGRESRDNAVFGPLLMIAATCVGAHPTTIYQLPSARGDSPQRTLVRTRSEGSGTAR